VVASGAADELMVSEDESELSETEEVAAASEPAELGLEIRATEVLRTDQSAGKPLKQDSIVAKKV